MPTLANSLRCLKHPITLLSIGLLLINDHVLKVVAPSWLTGKLSDFAGLFFFPFLLAIGLSWILRRASAQTIGALAFGITAIWFTLIKTTVWGNALTEEFVSRLLGVPVQIILDPTDLLALCVLFPAWQLWNRVKVERPTRLGWIALGVASLATVATSPASSPPPMISNVAAQDGKVFANVWSDGKAWAVSEDGGKNWLPAPSSVSVQPHSIKHPMMLCDSPNTQVCYRIAAKEQVEQSDDGGQSWRVAWQIPWGRREYMVRAVHCEITELLGCSRELLLGPSDMTLANPVGTDGLHTLVVALGTNGVLVRDPDGQWSMHGVLDILPIQFGARSLNDIWKVLRTETEIGFIFALVLLTVFSLYGIELIWVGENGLAYDSVVRPISIAGWITAAAFGLSYLACIFILQTIDIRIFFALIFEFFPIVGVGLLSVLGLGIFITWTTISQESKYEMPSSQMSWICIKMTFAVVVSGYGVLVLWALGIIPEYSIAFILSLVTSILTLRIAIRTMQRQGCQINLKSSP